MNRIFLHFLQPAPRNVAPLQAWGKADLPRRIGHLALLAAARQAFWAMPVIPEDMSPPKVGNMLGKYVTFLQLDTAECGKTGGNVASVFPRSFLIAFAFDYCEDLG